MTMSKLERYRRRGNKKVDGWFEPGAVEMIVALAKAQLVLGIAGHVAEIGVHRGRLFILLSLLRRAGEKAVAIDLFDLQHLNVDKSGEGDRAKLMANLARHADTKDVFIHQGDSIELSNESLVMLAGGKFRLFSVDGGHTAGITAHDLATAENSLAPGGIVILDDCFNESWPDVAVGTVRYFSRPRSIVPFAIGGNKVMFCQPAYAEKYRMALSDLTSRMITRTFLDCEVLCLNFKALNFVERVSKQAWWRLARNTTPLRMLRRFYRYLGPQ